MKLFHSIRRFLTMPAGLQIVSLGALFFAGCAEAPTASRSHSISGYNGPARKPSADMAESRSMERPGLGTGWGEGRESQTTRTSFVRADGNRPAATDRVFYNDRAGIAAMADYDRGVQHRVSGLVRVGGGMELGLKDGGGHWLEGLAANGRTFFAGEHGERYEVVVRNESGGTREVVLSVDGLDVMDGRAASFAKRGYIVSPGETLTVDGFRTSASTVAAFRFSSVARSYAALRHGDTRNVGVIGVAVFAERLDYVPMPVVRDAERRREANPFPTRRWAQPPSDSRAY